MQTNQLFPYDGKLIANHSIKIANEDGRQMSIMRLLKLVYMAHGWSLATLDRPLIDDRIEAWQYGPVIPAVYYAFRPQGIYNLSSVPVFPRELESGVESLLRKTYHMYRQESDIQLSKLTHNRGGPWYVTYHRDGEFSEIPDSLIKTHYLDKLKRVNRVSAHG